MNAKKIFFKTMPFNIAKLGLGVITVLLSVALLAILMGIGWLFGEGGILISFVFWILGTAIIRFVIMHYFGYLVKAGHIAVIAEAVTTGQIPDNQVAYGKAQVTKRFATSNIYFAVDKLVSAAVKQIQRGIQKVGNALDFIPGMGAISGLAQFFVNISLGYIDECCLGYTFYKKEQGAFQSAADGVVIYAQNWKLLLGSAAKTMLKVLLLIFLVLVVVFIPVGMIFKLLHWNALIAFLLACLIVWVIKFAFIDSYIMIQMMTAYMGTAPSTQITFDLYSKLCGLSSSFKELFNKGTEASPQPAYAGAASAVPAMAATAMTDAAPPMANPSPAAATAEPAMPSSSPATATAEPAMANPNSAAPARPSGGKPLFCGKCGAKLKSGSNFCGSCGAKIG